jgi:hypothetical protein
VRAHPLAEMSLGIGTVWVWARLIVAGLRGRGGVGALSPAGTRGTALGSACLTLFEGETAAARAASGRVSERRKQESSAQEYAGAPACEADARAANCEGAGHGIEEPAGVQGCRSGGPATGVGYEFIASRSPDTGTRQGRTFRGVHGRFH